MFYSLSTEHWAACWPFHPTLAITNCSKACRTSSSHDQREETMHRDYCSTWWSWSSCVCLKKKSFSGCCDELTDRLAFEKDRYAVQEVAGSAKTDRPQNDDRKTTAANSIKSCHDIWVGWRECLRVRSGPCNAFVGCLQTDRCVTVTAWCHRPHDVRRHDQINSLRLHHIHRVHMMMNLNMSSIFINFFSLSSKKHFLYLQFHVQRW